MKTIKFIPMLIFWTLNLCFPFIPVMEAIEWMKYNDTPKVKVQEMMAETCKPRYSWIRSDRAPTTAEILARYPRLLDPGIVSRTESKQVPAQGLSSWNPVLCSQLFDFWIKEECSVLSSKPFKFRFFSEAIFRDKLR